MNQTAEQLSIEVQPREATGSRSSRRLRRTDLVPAIVYGGGRDSVSIQVPRRALLELFKKAGSEHAVFLLKLAGSGKERHCMVREVETDPVTREVVHVDFQRIDLKVKVRVGVPVELVGMPDGVKNEGGVLDFVTREVEVECLPTAIPHHLVLDVSGLRVGQHAEARQLQVPDGVELHVEPERVIAGVSAARKAEAAEEGGTGLLESERAEPELVGRRRAEEEGEG
ncbi:MAG TPA: 50S ribosomal protein L25 [Thermoanaerobaculia bacterium]|nr:50S ribosomal protein L25 [Thermoanaerobaculia bacterium]